MIPFPYGASVAYFTLVRVAYVEGEPETYVLPLAVAFGERASQVQEEFPQAVVARLRGPGQEGLLYEAVGENSLHQALLESIAHRRHFKGKDGELIASHTNVFRHIQRLMKPCLYFRHHEGRAEQYLHRLQRLVHLEAHAPGGRRGESGLGNRSLSHRRILFRPQPPVAGALEYRPHHGQPITLGILHGFVPNQGDAWKYTLDVLGNFFEAALATKADLGPELVPRKPLVDLAMTEVPPWPRK